MTHWYGKERTKELTYPVELWYFVRKVNESDSPREPMSKIEFEAFIQYEPSKMAVSYEEYLRRVEERRLRHKEVEFVVDAVTVWRDNVDEVYTKISMAEDFIGWVGGK